MLSKNKGIDCHINVRYSAVRVLDQRKRKLFGIKKVLTKRSNLQDFCLYFLNISIFFNASCSFFSSAVNSAEKNRTFARDKVIRVDDNFMFLAKIIVLILKLFGTAWGSWFNYECYCFLRLLSEQGISACLITVEAEDARCLNWALHRSFRLRIRLHQTKTQIRPTFFTVLAHQFYRFR